MDWLEHAPAILTAIIGTAGIATAANKILEFSEPNRLRKRIMSNKEAAEMLTQGSDGRAKLDLACERDAARLAAVSLILTQPHAANRLRNIVFAICLVTFGGVAIGGCIYLFIPANELPSGRAREQYVSVFESALFGVIFAAICVTLVSVFRYYSDAQTRRIARESLATSIFVTQRSNSDIKAHVLASQVNDLLQSEALKKISRSDRKEAKRDWRKLMAQPLQILELPIASDLAATEREPGN